MATRRGICPYCKNEYIHNSIFLVNPEASTCLCGSSIHQINPKEAIDAYLKYIQDSIKKADDLLEVTCDPYGAYDAYADIIDVDDTIVHAYLGRILCLIYMSKTRKSYLDEAKILLETDSEKAVFTYLVNAPVVIEFLRRIVRVIEEYLIAIKKVLTFKKYFYDEDCLKLYFKHVFDALNLDNEILSLSNEIRNKDLENHDYDAFIAYLEEKIRDKDRILNDYDFITIDGKTYKFYKMKDDHSAEIVVLSKAIIDTKTSRYRMATLDPNNKKLRYIKDEIFRDYTKIIRNRKVAIVLGIISLVLAAIAGAGIYFFNDTFMYFIIAIAATAVFFILALISFVLVLTWGTEIHRKRRKMGAA